MNSFVADPSSDEGSQEWVLPPKAKSPKESSHPKIDKIKQKLE